MKDKKTDLTPQQQLFVKEYVLNFGNATRAYKKAFPNCKNKSADANGARMIANDRVYKAVELEYSKFWKEKDTEIERSKTLQLIKTVGDTDISDIIDLENGTFTVKSLSEIPPAARHAIQSIDYIEKSTPNGIDKTYKVKMNSKLHALELRAKIQNMIENKVEHTGTVEIVAAQKPTEDNED